MPQGNPSDALTGLNCGVIPAEGSVAAVLSSLSRLAPQPGDPVPKKTAKLLTEPDLNWRCECLEKVGHIPSGYTYLAQLMGHDMGFSVPVGSVPHVEPASADPDDPLAVVRPTGRYNLIRNPLTLETIYGAGPAVLSHLYDPQTLLFRLSPNEIQASLIWPQSAADESSTRVPVRALYDERNRDTLMLHELTVAWMQYHNLCALRLRLEQSRTPTQAYAEARAHVMRVWHSIIRDDLLPRFVHPVIAALEKDKLSPEWMLDEPALLFGLFRAFHSLPLAAYKFSKTASHNLQRLRKTGYLRSDAERFWTVDWDLFFGAVPGGPHSGISASVAEQLQTGAKLVAMMDLASAQDVVPLKAYDPKVMKMIKELPPGWLDRISAEQLAEGPAAQLAQDFIAAHPQAPGPTDAQVFAQVLATGPLYQFLMIEAQCHGHEGGFGPLGSALLRTSVEGSIARLPRYQDNPALADYETPKTMLELINLVRRTTEWPHSNT